MILRIIGAFALFNVLFAQLPFQPPVMTSSACLNECLQQLSVVFAADNLRNFEKIIVNIEQFCHSYEQLQKCASSCNAADQADLLRRTDLSGFICNDKIEEFRLVKECIESHDMASVSQCASDCGHSPEATIQLDSSPAASINPFSFFDSINPVCRTIECIVKCSISESNNKCAGAGDIFRELGHRQIYTASQRLHREAESQNASVAGELARIYLEALPDQCLYVVDASKYEQLFAAKDETGSEMVTEIASADGFIVSPTSELPHVDEPSDDMEDSHDYISIDNITPHQPTMESTSPRFRPTLEKTDSRPIPNETKPKLILNDGEAISDDISSENVPETTMTAFEADEIPTQPTTEEVEREISNNMDHTTIAVEETSTKDDAVDRTILVVNDDSEVETNEVRPLPNPTIFKHKNGIARCSLNFLTLTVLFVILI